MTRFSYKRLFERKLALGVIIGAATLIAISCGEGHVPHPFGTTKSADSVPLPVRGFFQTAITPAGTEENIDAFHLADTWAPDAQLFQVADGTGKASLRVKEAGATTGVDIAPASFYAKPTAVQNFAFRAVCATEVGGNYVDHGPRGDVFTYDRTNAGSRVSCWTNALGSPTWYRIDVVSSDGQPAPKDAYWLVAAAANDANPTTVIDVAYVRDSRWEPQLMMAAGRPTTDAFFAGQLSLDATGHPVFGSVITDVYPEMTGFATSAMPVDCTQYCGPVWSGLAYTDCGACPTGFFCQNRQCLPNSSLPCVPLSPTDACPPDGPGGPQACGSWPDGCGGWINCGGCPTGQSCGLEGDNRHCGHYPPIPTILSIRGTYNDYAMQLCGLFDDTAVTGVQVDLGPGCPLPGQLCQGNLCMPTAYPPPDTDYQNVWDADYPESPVCTCQVTDDAGDDASCSCYPDPEAGGG